MNDKPTPPEGYQLMLGNDFAIVPEGSFIWSSLGSKWLAFSNGGFEPARDCWYAIPLPKPNLDPKGEIGKTKPPMWLLPATALIETAWAMDDGAKKYQPYNWRETKVCASTYISAMMRHWAAYLDGEDVAPDSKVQNLAHIVANCNILMDSAKCGTLVDDRPKMP